jgi:hypothetical protein
VATLRSTPWTRAALASAALAIGSLGCPQPPATDADDVSAPLEIAGEGYATSDACRSCHPSQYASWRSSYHRTMTRPATPENVFGNFDDAVAYAIGHKFELRRRGDEFFATVPSPDWTGLGPPTYEEKRIALVTGRHHLQIYWFETGATRVVGSLPVAWDQMDQRWFPTDANFIKPPADHTRMYKLKLGDWNYGCIACHVTDERPQYLGPPHAMSEASELGIACEACHGPSKQHAEQMRSPDARYAEHLANEPARDIVNPARLDADRGSQVCGRCHSVWRHRSNEFYQAFLDDGVRYRPGGDLYEGGVSVVSDHSSDPGSFWPDGEVKPSGREYNGLKDSPCFEGGEFSCFSCHTMHPTGDAAQLEQWRDDQLKPGMRGDEACVQCHDELSTPRAVARHTHHDPGASGSECQNCHMPYTNLGLRKAIRSHTISSPNATTDRETGRQNACNGCHVDRPLGWTARALADWYGHPVPELTPVELAVPATAVDLLRGDAAERAIAASSLGWAPAVEVANAREWAPALLAITLEDPYDAVRYHAKRSLLRFRGYEDVEYDWVGPPALRRRQASAVLRLWSSTRRAEGHGAGLGWLLTPAEAGGADLSAAIFQALARSRDDSPIMVRE